MSRNQARRFALAFIAAGSVVLIDQASKTAALSALSEEERNKLVEESTGGSPAAGAYYDQCLEEAKPEPET